MTVELGPWVDPPLKAIDVARTSPHQLTSGEWLFRSELIKKGRPAVSTFGDLTGQEETLAHRTARPQNSNWM